MPMMTFDLEDGKPPVSFSINTEDAERFMDFMAECTRDRQDAADLRAKLAATEVEAAPVTAGELQQQILVDGEWKDAHSSTANEFPPEHVRFAYPYRPQMPEPLAAYADHSYPKYTRDQMVKAMNDTAALAERGTVGEPVDNRRCKPCASVRGGDTCWKCGSETFTPDPRCGEEPRLPPIDRIRELAKQVGYAIGVHGSQQRDFDVIAAPWTDMAIGNHALLQHLAAGLTTDNGPAHIISTERKPLGRYSATIQMDGWYKQLDISVCPNEQYATVPAPVQASFEVFPATEQEAARENMELVIARLEQIIDAAETADCDLMESEAKDALPCARAAHAYIDAQRAHAAPSPAVDAESVQGELIGYQVRLKGDAWPVGTFEPGMVHVSEGLERRALWAAPADFIGWKVDSDEQG